MGHDHHHYNHHHHHATGNLRVAFLLNLIFTIIEIIGGVLTNSLAILSDALHDLGDSLSLGLSWYFQRLSQRGKTDLFSYGFKRFSLLGAIINSLVLFAGSVIILIHAIPRLWQPETTDARGMLWLSILGIIINGAAVLRLRRGHSINEKVISLHLLEDVLGWVAVLVGSILMMYFDWPWIDPLLSLLISVYILSSVFKNLKESLIIILQGTPTGINMEEVRRLIIEIDQVVDIHDCHAWSMDGEYNVLTVHLVLDRNYDLTEQARIKRKVHDRLAHMPMHHTTIAFETKDERSEQIDC